MTFFALLPRCATASAQHRIRPLEVSTSTRSSPSKQGLVPRAGDPLAWHHKKTMAGHTNAAQSFWDRAAKKQEAELEKVGYKFSKEEEEERQSMRTVHENMAGSQDAPEFEADGEAAVKVPHWLDKCGAFDHSDMMYTKGQQQADNERRARAKQEEDSAVRAFRADAAKAPAPSVVVAPRVKNKVDEGPAPVLKRRRVDAPAPAPAPAPLSGLVAYGSSDSDSDDS